MVRNIRISGKVFVGIRPIQPIEQWKEFSVAMENCKQSDGKGCFEMVRYMTLCSVDLMRRSTMWFIVMTRPSTIEELFFVHLSLHDTQCIRFHSLFFILKT